MGCSISKNGQVQDIKTATVVNSELTQQSQSILVSSSRMSNVENSSRVRISEGASSSGISSSSALFLPSTLDSQEASTKSSLKTIHTTKSRYGRESSASGGSLDVLINFKLTAEDVDDDEGGEKVSRLAATPTTGRRRKLSGIVASTKQDDSDSISLASYSSVLSVEKSLQGSVTAKSIIFQKGSVKQLNYAAKKINFR